MKTIKLPLLKKTLMSDPGFIGTAKAKGIHVPTDETLQLKNKFVTFGEGNFVRSFVNWMIHRMNLNGSFMGSGVAIQPIDPGQLSREDLVSALTEQEGLYTTILRGLREGAAVDEKHIVSSLSRVLPFQSNTYWEDVLSLASNPDLAFVFSQTTEAGIRVHPDDAPEIIPPLSFPAKLTLFLYERFKQLGREESPGLTIIPTELNYRSGDMLQQTISEIAEKFNLEFLFRSWLKETIVICNSVVDSIITGKPDTQELNGLQEQLGYVDNAISIGEPFNLWVIEDKTNTVRKKLPLHRVAGLDVKFVDDLEIEHQKKMRVLCGAHTSMIAPSFLSGNESVKESMEDPLIGPFIKAMIYDEACRSMDVPYEEARNYADAIFERFVNPHIHHKLLTLSLNITSKAAERIVPSIVDLCRNKQVLPNYLSFAFAGYLYFMKGEGMTEDGMIYAHRTTTDHKKEKYFINDKDNAAFFFDAYRAVDLTDEASVGEFVTKTLGRADLWGEDLNYLLNGKFSESVRDHLHKIMNVGLRKALEYIMR